MTVLRTRIKRILVYSPTETLLTKPKITILAGDVAHQLTRVSTRLARCIACLKYLVCSHALIALSDSRSHLHSHETISKSKNVATKLDPTYYSVSHTPRLPDHEHPMYVQHIPQSGHSYLYPNTLSCTHIRATLRSHLRLPPLSSPSPDLAPPLQRSRLRHPLDYRRRHLRLRHARIPRANSG